MKNLISIIIPIYNVEKYIATCLESILEQSYPHIQIIAINDGSTDGSLAIAETYAAKDSRIILLSRENKGVAYTRNEALKLASGKWITFIDPDDSLDKQCYQDLEPAFAANPDLINFGVQTSYEGNLGTEEERAGNIALFKLQYPNGLMPLNDEIRCSLTNTVWNKIFKRSIIEQYNIDFPSAILGDDLAFVWKYIFQAKSIYINDKQFYFYLIRHESITHKAFIQKNTDYLFKAIKALEDIIIFARQHKIARNPQVFMHIAKLCLFPPLYLSHPKDKTRAKLAILRSLLKTWSNVYACRLGLAVLLYRYKANKAIARELKAETKQ